MPKVFEWNGYRFFFYSNEGQPPEPCHIHVRKGEALAKFWIIPEVSLVSSYGMAPHELNQLEAKIMETASLIQRRWHEHFDA